MKINLFAILILLFSSGVLTNNLVGQYSLDWAQIYGGDARDEAFSLIEDVNGNLFLAGYTMYKEKHLWVISIDEYGKPRWGKTFKAKPISEARKIIITTDSNLVTVGFSVKSFDNQRDLWILKLNPEGKLIWEKSYGGDGEEIAYSVAETNDGGFAIAGYTTTTQDYQEDAWILKLDRNGTKIWDRIIGGKKADRALDIIHTSDNGLVFCGSTKSTGQGYVSFWVAKTDSSGIDEWDRVVRFNKWDVATALTESLDHFIYVVGYTRTFSIIDYDIPIAKFDLQGNLIWQKTINWGKWDQATSITTTYDNGIAIAGFTKSGKEMSSDFVVTKIDGDGNVLWQNIFSRKSLDYPNQIIETKDNGLAIVGTTYIQGRGWDFALLKFKNNDQPQIVFFQDSVSTSIKSNFELKSCVKTQSNLKNVQLFFNDSLLLNHISRTNTIATSDCSFPINKNLNLLKGLNKIKLVITDFKNHKIINERKVIFIPPSEAIW